LSETANISARVPAYYVWVVQRLIGRRFKNKSDAVTQMMTAWLNAERAWLEANKLGIADFDGPRPIQEAASSSVRRALKVG
jgi:Arc/MetJ-type ribon-helix-helix transcriptional regulator